MKLCIQNLKKMLLPQTIKYEETLYVVRDFINFYDESLLEECDCGLEED